MIKKTWLFILLFSFFLSSSVRAEFGDIIDDFEAYSDGDDIALQSPPKGVYGGTLQTDFYVRSSDSYEGDNSLRLEDLSVSEWQFHYPNSDDYLTADFWFSIFYKFNSSDSGNGYIKINLKDSDGDHQNFNEIYSDHSPVGQWHQITSKVDFEGGQVDEITCYVDGNLAGTYSPSDMDNIKVWEFWSYSSVSDNLYYDYFTYWIPPWSFDFSLSPSYPANATTTESNTGRFETTGTWDYSISGGNEYTLETLKAHYYSTSTDQAFSFSTDITEDPESGYIINTHLPDGVYQVSYSVLYSVMYPGTIVDDFFLSADYTDYEYYTYDVEGLSTSTLLIVSGSEQGDWGVQFGETATSTAEQQSFFQTWFSGFLRIYDRVPVTYLTVFFDWFNDLTVASSSTSTLTVDLSAVGVSSTVQVINFETLLGSNFTYGNESQYSFGDYMKLFSKFIIFVFFVFFAKWWISWIFE